MSDITPQTIADRLQTLAAEMLDVAAEMDYFGGFSLIGQHGKELAGAAVIAQSWADGIREDYPAEDDSASEQPTDRAALQAAGTHPVPALPAHIFRELVNDLRDIAMQWHGSQQLRERISGRLRQDVSPAGTINPRTKGD